MPPLFKFLQPHLELDRRWPPDCQYEVCEALLYPGSQWGVGGEHGRLSATLAGPHGSVDGGRLSYYCRRLRRLVTGSTGCDCVRNTAIWGDCAWYEGLQLLSMYLFEAVSLVNLRPVRPGVGEGTFRPLPFPKLLARFSN